MRYRVSFTMETNVGLDQVQKHFKDQEDSVHEIVDESEKGHDAYISDIKVEELS
jgi:hypothetical protein